jgi:hypothetical protein
MKPVVASVRGTRSERPILAADGAIAVRRRGEVG